MLRLRKGQRQEGEGKMRMASQRRRTGTVFMVGIAVLAVASGAWAVISGGTAPANFAIQLDGETITTAKAYDLHGDIVNPGSKQYREYTLTLTLALKDNPAAAQAFVNGQAFASAKILLLAADQSVLKTYELASAAVVAYRQSDDAAQNVFEQQLVLKSRTLTIS
jgi:hypothetical protein